MEENGRDIEDNEDFIEKVEEIGMQSRVRDYFLNLKGKYENDRSTFEANWDEALRIYYNEATLSKVYDGYSNIRIPEVDKKVNGVVARIESILFNVSRIGRISAERTSMIDKDIITLQNRYIFENQLDDIMFKEAYHNFNLLQAIQGSSVAKISQEYEVKDFNDQEIVVKDNSFFRLQPLKSFYSDVTEQNIQNSRANILSTQISLEEIRKNRKRIIEEEVIIQNEFGEEIVIMQKKEVGYFINVGMVDPTGISDEFDQYLQILGISSTGKGDYNNFLKETKKTGMVSILECYGLYDLDGDGVEEEVLVVIANNNIVIRMDETPFKHRRYIRPFIFGTYKARPLCLYGESNVIKGMQLTQELNACRTQVTDAKSFSIFPQMYIDTSGGPLDWDLVWRPGGIIKGTVAKSPITPIINPNLSQISINDSTLMKNDLDELWSMSPVQQGTADRRHLPETGMQTNALIAQGEYVLDSIVQHKVETELKPLFEMLFERNLTFKTIDQMAQVLTEEEIQRLNLDQAMDLSSLVFMGTVKILGNMKLSKERQTQQGYERLLQLSKEDPGLARRLDPKEVAMRILASYGIQDDAEDLFIPEKSVQEQLQAEQQQQQAMQQLQQMVQQAQKVTAEQQNQIKQLATQNQQLIKEVQKQESVEMHIAKKQIDLQAEAASLAEKTNQKTIERAAEADIEMRSGKKVN